MKFSGLTGSLAKNLSYRLSKQGDKLADGSDVDERYVVIVHKKDCPTYEKEGNQYFFFIKRNAHNDAYVITPDEIYNNRLKYFEVLTNGLKSMKFAEGK